MCASALAAVLSVVGGILSVPAASAQGSVAEAAPAFYQPPAELPAGAGALMRTEAFPLAGAIPPIPGAEVLTDGAGPFSTDAQRIMYTSVGSRNQPVAVAGTYLQPRTPWTGPGTRPLAVLAPGTQGQGDHCAPSKTFQSPVSVRTEPLGVGFGYEILYTYALLARGFAVAVTDYEGLGTPGIHAYLNDSGRAMMAATSDQCIVETGVQFFTPGTESYTLSGRSVGDVLRGDPALMQALERQRIGRLKPSTPVQILSPLNDDVVPGPQSQQLGRDWCAQGVAVDMVIDPMPPLAPGLTLNHAVPLITNLAGTTQYLVDRINDRPAPVNCGTF